MEYFESCWSTPTKSSCKDQFLRLGDDDDDATEVFLVFGWLPYDDYKVLGWLDHKELARFERFEDKVFLEL